eukprot:GHVN01010465.1.p1 GENE.GHVN01010465.1~~GHVN01010465.1.p1  ORF type:complete len:506 (+),score=116.98 GHVN01010465.1:194-1519(+)
MPSCEGRLRELEEDQATYERQTKQILLTQTVGPHQVAEVVSRWSGIPVHKLTQEERSRILQLGIQMKQKVIGQDEAIDSVTGAVQRNRAGLSNSKRPVGSFLILGPTGVGKTELARVLAVELFDTEKPLIRFDMSEYKEEHSVARLTGAPPGYVGHEEGGQLTEVVRRSPYSVLLFDEIEKANDKVFDVMLQVLEPGRLTDGMGRSVDFTNTIILFTSNIGSEIILDASRIADETNLSDEQRHCIMSEAKTAVLEKVKQRFRPELLNRLDDIIVFNTLTPTTIREIVKLQLKDVKDRFADQHIRLVVTDDAVDHICSDSYNPSYGARPVRRYIDRTLVREATEKILTGEIPPYSTALCDWEETDLVEPHLPALTQPHSSALTQPHSKIHCFKWLISKDEEMSGDGEARGGGGAGHTRQVSREYRPRSPYLTSSPYNGPLTP